MLTSFGDDEYLQKQFTFERRGTHAMRHMQAVTVRGNILKTIPWLGDSGPRLPGGPHLAT
jgi:hypothetical protein